MNSTEVSLLEVDRLNLSFIQYDRGLRQKNLTVIRDLSLTIKMGEVLAVIGSSGSGKSLLAHAILGLLPGNARISGTITYSGQKLTPKSQADLCGREMALIPQSINFLDPLMRVGSQVRSVIRQGDKLAIQRDVFKRYHLPPETETMYPFQLSGGMARRTLAATAVVSGASLIIADEPTPGLHPEAVQETLTHLRELADAGKAVMLITHDIETGLKVADRIAVFYAGTIVEIATAADFADKGENLRHPYSKALWRALPQNGFIPTPGCQPLCHHEKSGCLFEPRCQMTTPECRKTQPILRELRNGMVKCYHAS